jgi:hypothetical protein
MLSVQFGATPDFVERYLRLDDGAAAVVDDAIRRLVVDPSSAWGRQSRVVSERGSAWLIIVRCRAGNYSLYWDQPDPGQPVQLLLLLRR